MEKIFVHVFIVASSLQLFMTASSLPLPSTTDCNCNNKPVIVNGNLLSNWLDPTNDESRISTITMKADNVLDYIDNVSGQVRTYEQTVVMYMISSHIYSSYNPAMYYIRCHLHTC